MTHKIKLQVLRLSLDVDHLASRTFFHFKLIKFRLV